MKILATPLTPVCHLSIDEERFNDFRRFDKPKQVALGGGRELEAVVLYVPRLSYNLLSLFKAADTGKTMEFDNVHCRIIGEGGKLLAIIWIIRKSLEVSRSMLLSQRVSKVSGTDDLAT